MAAKGELAPTISSYAASMQELDQLLNEIETSIHGGRIVDHASKELAKIRKNPGDRGADQTKAGPAA